MSKLQFKLPLLSDDILRSPRLPRVDILSPSSPRANNSNLLDGDISRMLIARVDTPSIVSRRRPVSYAQSVDMLQVQHEVSERTDSLNTQRADSLDSLNSQQPSSEILGRAFSELGISEPTMSDTLKVYHSLRSPRKLINHKLKPIVASTGLLGMRSPNMAVNSPLS